MQLYKSKNHMFNVGGATGFTMPTEIVGLDMPKNFVANVGFVAAGSNDPTESWMTGFGIRYVALKAAREDMADPSHSKRIVVESPSGAQIVMSVVVNEPNSSLRKLVQEVMVSLPSEVQHVMFGRNEVWDMPLDMPIGFLAE